MPDTDDPHRGDPEPLRVRSHRLLAVVAAGGPDRASAREQLVLLHRPLVEHCVRRYRGRGEAYEDLVQVGMVGLLLAVDRFDPARGLQFTSLAAPTIRGELRRWFRDKGRSVRVPRRLQELQARLGARSADLVQELGRSPTPAELARDLGCTVADVAECLRSERAYATVPLDLDAPGGAPAWAGPLGVEDEALVGVVVRESVRPLLEQLPVLDKEVLLLRFWGGLTQSQIAAEVGLSQMQVSRLLAQTLSGLRSALDLPPERRVSARGPAAPPTRGGPPRAPPPRRSPPARR